MSMTESDDYFQRHSFHYTGITYFIASSHLRNSYQTIIASLTHYEYSEMSCQCHCAQTSSFHMTAPFSISNIFYYLVIISTKSPNTDDYFILCLLFYAILIISLATETYHFKITDDDFSILLYNSKELKRFGV